MTNERAFASFNFANLSPRERYKLLIGTVVPRPIAFVTTVGQDGVVKAAPYSFFNCLSADPAIVALGIEYRHDGSSKDTARNVQDTGVFTVNIVSNAVLDAMNVCAIPFPPGTDELAQAGLRTISGTHVASPRIAACPAASDCRHCQTLHIGNSREIVLGEVLCIHLRSDAVDEAALHVDPVALDAIGRMGGHGYVRTHGPIDLPAMTVDE
ncbi:MAG: flavin reductase family protein, partial [Alphaproteobacteria bacterium]|nr:flavin reductase family protein [Alphaproteobacteria bacterium]